ncbi:hypothetical protein DH2020_016731 [Rehmannia glutinosa]|uniref:Uncharacterized protein n=1 Tax=Rehmannia glutinosa TaxID=99300 RepID=A0ABR0WRH8_REHGL
MGRGRGKGKKQSSIGARDDTASGEDEKFSVRRRGRPQKPLKDNIEEEDKVVKIEDKDDNDDVEEIKSSVLSKNTKNQAATENGRKRKRPSQVKENGDSVKEQNGIVTKTNANDLIKSVGYRQNGSRRKTSLDGLLKLALSANEYCIAIENQSFDSLYRPFNILDYIAKKPDSLENNKKQVRKFYRMLIRSS